MFLHRDKLKVGTESIVYSAIYEWIQFHKNNLVDDDYMKLLDCIRFPLIPLDYLCQLLLCSDHFRPVSFNPSEPSKAEQSFKSKLARAITYQSIANQDHRAEIREWAEEESLDTEYTPRVYQPEKISYEVEYQVDLASCIQNPDFDVTEDDPWYDLPHTTKFIFGYSCNLALEWSSSDDVSLYFSVNFFNSDDQINVLQHKTKWFYRKNGRCFLGGELCQRTFSCYEASELFTKSKSSLLDHSCKYLNEDGTLHLLIKANIQ